MTTTRPYDDFVRNRRRKYTSQTLMPITTASSSSSSSTNDVKVTHGVAGLAALATFLHGDLQRRQSMPVLGPQGQAKAVLAFVGRFYEPSAAASDTTEQQAEPVHDTTM
jgi:hypothetical protein